ncbi:MAG: LPS export ABC transporter periplasmic protein LptC [Flavobacteriales bacterium]|nr:LPS export ABC transporter periplasmic protein LptC [Flavobacteriales bacterium]
MTREIKHIIKNIPAMVMVGMFFLFLSITSCENDLNQVKVVTTTDDAPDEIVNNLHTIYSDSGIVKFEIVSSRTEEYSKPKQKTLFKDGFTVNFFKGKDSIVSTLSADYAEMRKEENLIIARNKVIFTNFETGKTLKTEELYWDQQSKRVRTEKRFEIIGKESRLEGFGVDSDETFSDYVMHDVTGEYILKDTAQ